MLSVTLDFVPNDPFAVWRQLHPSPRLGFYLGSPLPSRSHPIAYFSVAEPRRVWSILSLEDVSTYQHLAHRLSQKISNDPHPSLFGFLGFEAGRFFDEGLRRIPIKKNDLQTPLIEFGEYPVVVKLDYVRHNTVIFSRTRSQLNSAQQKIKSLIEKDRLRAEKTILSQSNLFQEKVKISGRRVSDVNKTENERFTRMVRRAKESIQRGDIYQANLSLRFVNNLRVDPRELYRQVYRRNPSPYAGVLKTSAGWLVSSSPELLMAVNQKTIRTRPIAGTRPRGNDRRQDSIKRGQLLLSPKERAEHIMLVDLERNDIGRVAQAGSVKVSESFGIERYSHVMHIVSEVTGRLRKNATAFDGLKALFPGGTITGCPKIRSIELIEENERIARGPFYGSAGFFCENGDAVFNILIRTALVQKNKVGQRVYVQAGAGIVADSNPSREYREVLAKAAALRETIQQVNQ